MGSETDSQHGDTQGEHPSRRTGRSRSPRGMSHSEPQTPLPIDPPQLNLGQLSNPIYHHPDWTKKPHTNPRTCPGKNSELMEGAGGSSVDGLSPNNDPEDDAEATYGPGSQGDGSGTHTVLASIVPHAGLDLVPTRPDPNQTENYRSGGGRGLSRTFLSSVKVLGLIVPYTDRHLPGESSMKNPGNFDQSRASPFVVIEIPEELI